MSVVQYNTCSTVFRSIKIVGGCLNLPQSYILRFRLFGITDFGVSHKLILRNSLSRSDLSHNDLFTFLILCQYFSFYHFISSSLQLKLKFGSKAGFEDFFTLPRFNLVQFTLCNPARSINSSSSSLSSLSPC